MIAQIENNKVLKIFSGNIDEVQKFVGTSEIIDIGDKPLVVGDRLDKDLSIIEIEKGTDEIDQSIEIEIIHHLNYLTHTDWYVIRFMETGKEIPEEVLAMRAKSREEISGLRGK